MTNTMADLRRKVATHIRDTLHGKEIDTIEKGMPELPHMLGIVPLGAISTAEAEKETILDPMIDFWKEYYEDVNTRNAVCNEIETAMHSLKEDGVFRVSMPYGKDAGIHYVEVGETGDSRNRMVTICAECGESIPTEPELSFNYGRYSLVFKLDCPECEFSQTTGKMLSPQ